MKGLECRQLAQIQSSNSHSIHQSLISTPFGPKMAKLPWSGGVVNSFSALISVRPCRWNIQPRAIKESEQVAHGEHPNWAVLELAMTSCQQYVVPSLQFTEGLEQRGTELLSNLFGAPQNVERFYSVPRDLSN